VIDSTASWLPLTASALTGALLGAAACWWPMQRRLRALRERMLRCEQARNGAIERSARAREQIAQINRAIDDIRRSHSVHGSLADLTTD
jgi:hypothetical protein